MDANENLNYLSTNKISQTKGYQDDGMARLNVRLSDTKFLRQRAVYNIVDLIADVSGLADILLVFSTLIMTTLYTKRVFDMVVIKHISNIRRSLRPNLSSFKKYNHLHQGLLM